MTASPNAVQKPKVLIYSCSGASSAAQMANWIAIQLDRRGLAEMSCIAGVGGGVDALVKKAASAQTIIAVDGCPLDCVEVCLKRAGLKSTHHFDLSSMGVPKRFHQDFDMDLAHEILAKIIRDLERSQSADSEAGALDFSAETP